MITAVYFIERLYLYTEVVSSGRGVLGSSEQGVTGTVSCTCACQKDTAEGCVVGRHIGGGYSR